MKATAVLINNARGSVVDLDALRSAIESESIAGAAAGRLPGGTILEQRSVRLPARRTAERHPHPAHRRRTEEAQEQIAAEVAVKLARYARTGTTTSAVNVPEVDLPLRPEDQVRLLHFHRNVPGVLSKMHAIIAEHEINITAEYLRTTGELSYVILDCGHLQGTDAIQRLESLEETIRLRVLRSD